MTERQNVEIFHLLFMRMLGEHLDKEHYALKGGCNLRFFMRSIRYSEDIDFDVRAAGTVAKDTLKSKIRKILKSASLGRILRTRGLEIVEYSEPKQTDTTQRWKVSLRAEGSEIPLHTKIEFSRRNLDKGTVFEDVEPELIHGYGLYPPFAVR